MRSRPRRGGDRNGRRRGRRPPGGGRRRPSARESDLMHARSLDRGSRSRSRSSSLLGASPRAARGRRRSAGARRPLHDIAERLVGEEDDVRAALDDLRERRGITLYVVTLDTIDGEDPALFADAIAATNDLGPMEAVLFVSFDDRQFGMWTGVDLGVRPEPIDELLLVLGDYLRAGDPRRRLVSAAANLERLVDGLPRRGRRAVPGAQRADRARAHRDAPGWSPLRGEEYDPPFGSRPSLPASPWISARRCSRVGAVGGVIAAGAGGLGYRRRRGEIAGARDRCRALVQRAAQLGDQGRDGRTRRARVRLRRRHGRAVPRGCGDAELSLHCSVPPGAARGRSAASDSTAARRSSPICAPRSTRSRRGGGRSVEERTTLDTLAASADDLTAELVDALSRLRERQAVAADGWPGSPRPAPRRTPGIGRAPRAVRTDALAGARRPDAGRGCRAGRAASPGRACSRCARRSDAGRSSPPSSRSSTSPASASTGRSRSAPTADRRSSDARSKLPRRAGPVAGADADSRSWRRPDASMPRRRRTGCAHRVGSRAAGDAEAGACMPRSRPRRRAASKALDLATRAWAGTRLRRPPSRRERLDGRGPGELAHRLQALLAAMPRRRLS